MEHTAARTLSLLFLSLILHTAILAQGRVESLDELKGKWTYEAPTAPSGYEKGAITIAKEANQWIGNVRIEGSEYKTTEIKLKSEESYSLSLILDGYEVNVTLKKVEPKIFKGQAVAEGMSIPVTLSKND